LKQAHGDAKLFIGHFAMAGALVQQSQKLVARTEGEALIELLRQLDRLKDDRNAFLVPPRVELKLAETEEHMALGSLGPSLFEVCQSTPKDVLGSRSLSFLHQEESELVLSTRHQGFVIFQRIQSERLVRELDGPADVASLLVSDAQAVVCPTQSG
jgi:hypothetical protein